MLQNKNQRERFHSRCRLLHSPLETQARSQGGQRVAQSPWRFWKSLSPPVNLTWPMYFPYLPCYKGLFGAPLCFSGWLRISRNFINFIPTDVKKKKNDWCHSRKMSVSQSLTDVIIKNFRKILTEVILKNISRSLTDIIVWMSVWHQCPKSSQYWLTSVNFWLTFSLGQVTLKTYWHIPFVSAKKVHEEIETINNKVFLIWRGDVFG